MKRTLIFPGTGYACKEPLLQQIQGMLEDKGHKVIALDYSAIPFKDIEAIDQAVDISMGFCISIIKDIESSDKLLFVSKSLGCITAVRLSNLLKLQARHIMLTPPRAALDEAIKPDEIIAMVIGEQDNYVDKDYTRNFCNKRSIPCLVIEGVGHSLKNGKEDESINLNILSFLKDKE